MYYHPPLIRNPSRENGWGEVQGEEQEREVFVGSKWGEKGSTSPFALTKIRRRFRSIVSVRGRFDRGIKDVGLEDSVDGFLCDLIHTGFLGLYSFTVLNAMGFT
jgi:hypothetical protein